MKDYVITNNFGAASCATLFVNDIDSQDKTFVKLNREKNHRRYILSLAEAIDTLSSGIYQDNPQAVIQMQKIADRLKIMAKNYKIKVSMKEEYRRASTKAGKLK